jgi:hypothetical protein
MLRRWQDAKEGRCNWEHLMLAEHLPKPLIAIQDYSPVTILSPDRDKISFAFYFSAAGPMPKNFWFI